MTLFGIGGVPEPNEPKSPQTVSNNGHTGNDAASIFNSLNKNNDNVIDENDGVDNSMLAALRELVGGGKLTLKNLTKVSDKLSGFTYTKTQGEDNIVYNIQGQQIRTSNTKFDAKGNITSDNVEEYVFVKDADGNDLKVKINIDKNACVSKRAYESLMKQLVSEVNSLSPQGRADLVNEVDGIKVNYKAIQGHSAGQFVTGENVIILYVNGNGRASSPGIYSLPQIMSDTISHELGHAIDEHNGDFRLSQQIDTKGIRKSLYDKIDFNKYTETQRYFLFGGEDEFAAEYYAYKYGGNQNSSRYDLMREVEKFGNKQFEEAAKTCEKNWAEARQNTAETPKDVMKVEKGLQKIELLHRLKGASFYRNEFFNIGEKLAPDDADEGLTNTEILQKYYLYKMGKCDEATANKFASLIASNDSNWATLEPIILKEFKRIGIEL